MAGGYLAVSAGLGGVPVVPVGRGVHVEREHIARLVACVVGAVEHLVYCQRLAVDIGDGVALSDERLVGRRCAVVLEHVLSGGILSAVDGAGFGVDPCVPDEELLLDVGQHAVVPVAYHVVQVVGLGLVVHLHALGSHLGRARVVGIVGVEVGLHVHQCQLAVASGGDGERYLDFARVGGGRTCVGRDHLVVDIHVALDEPVVGRRLHVAVVVDSVVGIAVVDDALLAAVDEVARGLDVLQSGGTVLVALVGHGGAVVLGEGHVGS